MTMTKNDYLAVADAMFQAKPSSEPGRAYLTWSNCAISLADKFGGLNSSFDRKRFMAMCENGTDKDANGITVEFYLGETAMGISRGGFASYSDAKDYGNTYVANPTFRGDGFAILDYPANGGEPKCLLGVLDQHTLEKIELEDNYGHSISRL